MTAGIKANVDGSAAIQVGGVDAITLTSAGAASFVTSPMTIQGGSASAPSLTFSGDTNTGIFSPAADTIAFSEGGVESMRIDASGNLLVGTTSSLYSSANRGVIEVNGSTSSLLGFKRGDANGFYIHNTSTTVDVWNQANTPIVFATNNSERARIIASGDMYVSGSGASVNVTGWAGVYQYGVGSIGISRNGSNVLAFFHTSNASGLAGSPVGTVSITTTATTYATSSDYRLKEDIQPMTGALAKVSALKPCTYKWKSNGSDGQGFIAHELAEVCPQAVVGEKDAVETYTDEEGNEQTRPVYQGIDTSFLVATLTAAIQEQQQMIETLQAKVAALESA